MFQVFQKILQKPIDSWCTNCYTSLAIKNRDTQGGAIPRAIFVLFPRVGVVVCFSDVGGGT